MQQQKQKTQYEVIDKDGRKHGPFKGLAAANSLQHIGERQ